MTEMTEMIAGTVEDYVRFWNTDPAEQRRSAIFAEGFTSVTPVAVHSGVESLAEFTEQFAGHVGAYEFRARSTPDVHHDRARLPWELRVGDKSFAEGTDILVTDEEGRIVSVTSFLDRAPEGFDPAHH